jgi:Skp family chaperone for outer membrane proteins
MLGSPRFWASVAVLVAAGVLGTGLPGQAQKGGKTKADSGVGYVDLVQITEEVKKSATWQAKVQGFEDRRQKARTSMEQLQKTRYLSATDREQLRNLEAKPKPSDTEQAKILELRRKSDELDAEFQRLAGVEKPTDKDKSRLQELTGIRETAISQLQAEEQKKSDELQGLQVTMLQEMDVQIRKAVEQIAESRSLWIVLDRQMLWYGGQDLTADVLKKLGSR